MVATKTQPMQAVDKQKATQLLKKFLEQYKNCCKQKQAPNAASFESMLAPNFQNTSNGRVIGRNIQDVVTRIQTIQKRFASIDFSNIQECLVSGNRATVEYDMTLMAHNGEKRVLHAIAIATIDGDMITQWTQVSHNKETDHLDS